MPRLCLVSSQLPAQRTRPSALGTHHSPSVHPHAALGINSAPSDALPPRPPLYRRHPPRLLRPLFRIAHGRSAGEPPAGIDGGRRELHSAEARTRQRVRPACGALAARISRRPAVERASRGGSRARHAGGGDHRRSPPELHPLAGRLGLRRPARYLRRDAGGATLSSMKRGLAMLACAALAAPLLADSKQGLSPVYGIDRKYKSMEGPSASQTVYLGDPAKPELVWITGMRTEVVGEDGHTPALPELMCHVNIDIDPLMHRTLFNLERMPMARLLTISQGMLATTGGFTARLPKGFGMPFISSEPLTVMTQVLNHNLEHPHLRVRHRVTFEYTRDADLQAPLRPLFNLGASAMVV